MTENFYYFVSFCEESIALKHNREILSTAPFTFESKASDCEVGWNVRSNEHLDFVRDRVVAGRYRLERLLGEGATGRVYLARDTKERGSVWAVKELDYSGLTRDQFLEARELFGKESALLAKLRHPGLPRVVAHFQEGECDYLVMERVEGPTLEGLLSAGEKVLPEPQVVELGLALAEILHYLHSRRPAIIYRDLKPANVMVSVDATVKLIDFGIARAVNPVRAGDTTAYGTPGFAPPEQYQGRTCPASDVYALGVTLLCAATRYEPTEFTFTHPSPASLNPSLSDAFDHLLSQMVAKDPRERPEIGEVLAMLSAMQDSSAHDPLRVWWRRKSREVLRWWKSRSG